jgi:glucosyl-dolichyl phosphate glucuronosyltransferase
VARFVCAGSAPAVARSAQAQRKIYEISVPSAARYPHPDQDVSLLLTVAICTRNRAKLLRQTLEQMTRVAISPAMTWELIVVENNCSDDSVGVSSEFRDRLPIRTISEERLGLSNARNTAVAAARGQYIVWTDDDVLVDEGWLTAYVSAFERYPDATIFGGPISPWFEGRPPRWLAEVATDIGSAFAVRDADREDPITEKSTPFGANMAFRTDVMRSTPFDPTLGRTGNTMLGYEETAVIEALLRRGHTGRWVPGARVRHYIPTARQNTTYVRRYYAGDAATQELLSDGLHAQLLFGKPRWMWREVITREIVYRLHRLYAHPAVWIADLKLAGAAWGRFQLDWTRPAEANSGAGGAGPNASRYVTPSAKSAPAGAP